MGQIKAIITDLDGVLTDGGMYYQSVNPVATQPGTCSAPAAADMFAKRFHTRDAGAARWLHENTNVKLFVITAGDSPRNNAINEERMEVMYLTEPIMQGVMNKYSALNEIRDRHSLRWSEIVYIGDDRADIEVMETVGIACCPKDALRTVQEICGLVSVADGGHGVLADIVDKLLASGDIEEKKE